MLSDPPTDSLRAQLRALPKVDLHLHLTGCARLPTVIELAEARGVELPADARQDIDTFMTFAHAAPSYAESFRPWRRVLNHLTHLPGVLPRLASELADDLADDGVVYAEVRVSPRLLHASGVLADTLAELDRVRREKHAEVGVDMRFVLGLTREFFIGLAVEDQRSLGAAFAEAADRYRGDAVVGFDLWGNEATAPPGRFAAAFDVIREAGYPLTIHCGEIARSSDVREAVEHLHAARVGHAVRAVDDPSVLRLLRAGNVVVETCLRSNVVTGAVASLASHPIRAMLDAGIDVALGTDNRAIHLTTLTNEYALGLEAGLFSPSELLRMMKVAATRAFASGAAREAIVGATASLDEEAVTG